MSRKKLTPAQARLLQAKLNPSLSPGSDRHGDWIATFTGKKFYPFDPRIEDINITDMAHAMSNICRFGGHCTTFYPIAQHSVLVSLMCPPGFELWGLMHDGPEYVLVDIPSPLKKMPEFKPYRDAEAVLMNVICDAFNLPHGEPHEVKTVDKRMLATEARDLTFTQGRGWSTPAEPYDFNIVPWTPQYAEVRFLSRFHELTRTQ